MNNQFEKISAESEMDRLAQQSPDELGDEYEAWLDNLPSQEERFDLLDES